MPLERVAHNNLNHMIETRLKMLQTLNHVPNKIGPVMTVTERCPKDNLSLHEATFSHPHHGSSGGEMIPVVAISPHLL